MDAMARSRGAKCPQSSWSCDAIDGQPVSALEPPDRPLGARSEVAVDDESRSALRKQELSHGDIPAETPSPHRSTAEPWSSKRPEGVPRRRAESAVNIQAGSPLELPQTARRHRPVDPVDRPEVQATGAKRDLKARHLRPHRSR